MNLENLAYAVVQVAHNFGAAAVLGGAVFALWPVPYLERARAFGWVIVAGWATQIASGILFGVVSLHYYGETPDLAPVAMVALAVKVTAAVAGLLLAAAYLRGGAGWDQQRLVRRFRILAALAATALTAAAFLRWFS